MANSWKWGQSVHTLYVRSDWGIILIWERSIFLSESGWWKWWSSALNWWNFYIHPNSTLCGIYNEKHTIADISQFRVSIDDEKSIDANKHEREHSTGWKLGNFLLKGLLGVFITHLGLHCGITDVQYWIHWEFWFFWGGGGLHSIICKFFFTPKVHHINVELRVICPSLKIFIYTDFIRKLTGISTIENFTDITKNAAH